MYLSDFAGDAMRRTVDPLPEKPESPLVDQEPEVLPMPDVHRSEIPVLQSEPDSPTPSSNHELNDLQTPSLIRPGEVALPVEPLTSTSVTESSLVIASNMVTTTTSPSNYHGGLTTTSMTVSSPLVCTSQKSSSIGGYIKPSQSPVDGANGVCHIGSNGTGSTCNSSCVVTSSCIPTPICTTQVSPSPSLPTNDQIHSISHLPNFSTSNRLTEQNPAPTTSTTVPPSPSTTESNCHAASDAETGSCPTSTCSQVSSISTSSCSSSLGVTSACSSSVSANKAALSVTKLSTQAHVREVVSRINPAKTVRITPPPGISLAPPPLKAKSESPTKTVNVGHRVVVAPGVSTRTVESLASAVRTTTGHANNVSSYSNCHNTPEDGGEENKELKDTDGGDNPSLTSINKVNSENVDVQTPNEAGVTATDVPTRSVSVSSPSSVASDCDGTNESVTLSQVTVTSSVIQTSIPALITSFSESQTVPAGATTVSSSAAVVSATQEYSSTSGPVAPSPDIMSRLAPQSLPNVIPQVTPTVMTVVVPPIVPPLSPHTSPLIRRNSPHAKSQAFNSEHTSPISLRDITKEKGVVSLMTRPAEIDSKIVEKCRSPTGEKSATGKGVSPSKDILVPNLPAGPEGANGGQDQQYQQRRQTQSKGISILKPLFDRDNEPLDDADMEALSDMKWSRGVKKPGKAGGDVHNNSNTNHESVLPHRSSSSQYTIAQLLEEAQKRKMKVEQNSSGQQQLPTSPLVVVSQDTIGKVSSQQQPLPTSMAVSQQQHPQSHQPVSSAARSALTSKPANAAGLKPHALADYPRNSGLHLSNFMAKSMHTPPLINSHPMTAPGFALNLTESVQKVMSAIPCSDSLSPPSHPPRLNRPHGRANVSPSAKDKLADVHGDNASTSTIPPLQTKTSPAGSGKAISPSPCEKMIKQEQVDVKCTLSSDANLIQSLPKVEPRLSNIRVKIENSTSCSTQSGGTHNAGNCGSEVSKDALFVENPLTLTTEASSSLSMQNEHMPLNNSKISANDNPNNFEQSKAAHPADSKNMCSTPVKCEMPGAYEAFATTATPPVAETPSKSGRACQRKSVEKEETNPSRITRRRSRESTESLSKEREESPRATPTRGRKKTTSESSDATLNSEASNDGMTLRGGRSTDRSSERSVSPPTRSTRSTRSVRKKTSPDCEESTGCLAAETERPDSPKPLKQTRGSKRRLDLDDASVASTDKKIKLEENVGVGKEDLIPIKPESSEDDHTLSELRKSGKVTRAGAKGGAKEERCGSEERISPKGRKGIKGEENKETEEQTGAKRCGKVKTSVTEEARKSVAGATTRRATEKRPKSPVNGKLSLKNQ